MVGADDGLHGGDVGREPEGLLWGGGAGPLDDGLFSSSAFGRQNMIKKLETQKKTKYKNEFKSEAVWQKNSSLEPR